MEVKTRIDVECPMCSSKGTIEIPTSLIKGSRDGIAKVMVRRGACCPVHSFFTFIDKSGKVRAYDVADVECIGGLRDDQTVFSLKISDASGSRRDLSELIEILSQSIMGIIVRTILAGKPVMFIEDESKQSNLTNSIASFIQDIGSDTCPVRVNLISQEDLREKKVRELNPLVISVRYQAIIWSPFLDTLQLNLESSILRRVVQIPDRGGQIIALRQEIIKISSIIKELASSLEKGKPIYEEDLPGYLKTKYNYEIAQRDVRFIKEMIAFTHSKKIADKIISKLVDILL